MLIWELSSSPFPNTRSLARQMLGLWVRMVVVVVMMVVMLVVVMMVVAVVMVVVVVMLARRQSQRRSLFTVVASVSLADFGREM